MGGFTKFEGALQLAQIPGTSLYSCQKTRVLLGEKNTFCYFKFTIGGSPSTKHPSLIMAIHPSSSKNGWQVWLTMDLNSLGPGLVSIPPSLSSNFKCILSQNFEVITLFFLI